MILAPPYTSMIAQAHNGSGKTTCFTLAMLSRVDPRLQAPQARRGAGQGGRWVGQGRGVWGSGPRAVACSCLPAAGGGSVGLAPSSAPGSKEEGLALSPQGRCPAGAAPLAPAPLAPAEPAPAGPRPARCAGAVRVPHSRAGGAEHDGPGAHGQVHG
jgi:hypothetical protein